MADNIELKNNLMSFREAFREYTDYYTVIGGTACMILMEEASRDFRATKDVDMILIMEDGGKEFCKTFWEYILRAKYTCFVRNNSMSTKGKVNEKRPCSRKQNTVHREFMKRLK